MNLVQLLDRNGARRVAVPSSDGRALNVRRGNDSVRDLALEVARNDVPSGALVAERLVRRKVTTMKWSPNDVSCHPSTTRTRHTVSSRGRRSHIGVARSRVTPCTRSSRLRATYCQL